MKEERNQIIRDKLKQKKKMSKYRNKEIEKQKGETREKQKRDR